LGISSNLPGRTLKKMGVRELKWGLRERGIQPDQRRFVLPLSSSAKSLEPGQEFHISHGGIEG